MPLPRPGTGPDVQWGGRGRGAAGASRALGPPDPPHTPPGTPPCPLSPICSRSPFKEEEEEEAQDGGAAPPSAIFSAGPRECRAGRGARGAVRRLRLLPPCRHRERSRVHPGRPPQRAVLPSGCASAGTGLRERVRPGAASLLQGLGIESEQRLREPGGSRRLRGNLITP